MDSITSLEWCEAKQKQNIFICLICGRQILDCIQSRISNCSYGFFLSDRKISLASQHIVKYTCVFVLFINMHESFGRGWSYIATISNDFYSHIFQHIMHHSVYCHNLVYINLIGFYGINLSDSYSLTYTQLFVIH